MQSLTIIAPDRIATCNVKVGSPASWSNMWWLHATSFSGQLENKKQTIPNVCVCVCVCVISHETDSSTISQKINWIMYWHSMIHYRTGGKRKESAESHPSVTSWWLNTSRSAGRLDVLSFTSAQTQPPSSSNEYQSYSNTGDMLPCSDAVFSDKMLTAGENNSMKCK